MAFIELRGLTKRFGSHTAIQDITLDIAEREFVTFLGPSGCGKTTTLRLIAGFMAPDQGTIHVAGRALSAPSDVVPPEQRRMGMVFQNYAIWPHMTVFGNIAFGLRLARLPKREIASRVARIVAAVGLEGLEDRHAAQLSGGQQQRIALARSLVLEPSILMLDEPLSNLDAKLRERLRDEIKALQRRTGITFIYVTHDQAEAMALSDRIAVFDRGRIEQVGMPRDIYDQPVNLFIADFMGQVNRLPGRVVEQSAGLARVDVAGHVFRAVPSPGLASGAVTATVAIRPEAIRIGPAAPHDEANQFEGTVTQATFLGNAMDYSVDIGGAILRVQGGPQDAHAAGDRAWLTIPVRRCAAMPDAN